MPPSRVIVIGASAGGIEAVSVVIAGLTPELRAAVLVVIHTGRGEDGLVTVLARAAPVPVLPAKDGNALADAHVYIARPDRHLAVENGVMRVVMGPSQHGFRPAVDVLFHSAAEAAGPRVAGVILSGALSDGVSGLRAIKQAGGRAIVQNPEQAQFPGMPLAALREVEVDAVLPLGQIAADLARWARRERQPPAASAAPRSQTAAPRELVERRTPGRHEGLIPISCPSRGGALAQTHERESGDVRDAPRPAWRGRTIDESGRNGGGRRARRGGRSRRNGGSERPARAGERGRAAVRPQTPRSPRSERAGRPGASERGGRARAGPNAGSSRNGGERQRRAEGGEPAEPSHGHAPATMRGGSESTRRH